MTASGGSGIPARRGRRMRALCEPGCHEGERSGLACISARRLRGRGPVLRPDLGLVVAFDEGNAVELAAGNGDRVQLFGPATVTSSSTAATAPASSRCSRSTTWIRRAPSWSAAAPCCSASRSQTAPGPGSPTGHPMGTSQSGAPGRRSRQLRRLRLNSLDMRQLRTFT